MFRSVNERTKYKLIFRRAKRSYEISVEYYFNIAVASWKTRLNVTLDGLLTYKFEDISVFKKANLYHSL